MKTKLILLVLLIASQGCTVVGGAMDGLFPAKHQAQDNNRKTLIDVGLAADMELAKSIVNDEPLPGHEAQQKTGCKKLPAKKQKECYQVSEQLNKSLAKHKTK